MNKTDFSDVKLYLDPAAAGRTISPMLFGYNVEITRLGVWRGLSTEMVNNRKFAVADENGKALRWIVCGDPGNVSVDPAFGYAGNRSLRISGKDCGVCQVSEALAFAAGRTYALRLVVYSEEPVPVANSVKLPLMHHLRFIQLHHFTHIRLCHIVLQGTELPDLLGLILNGISLTMSQVLCMIIARH